MMRDSSVACFLLAAISLPLPAQKPIINPSGIVNAASYQPWDQPGHLLAPGSIAVIFGQNLATGTVVATSVPLPPSMVSFSPSASRKVSFPPLPPSESRPVPPSSRSEPLTPWRVSLPVKENEALNPVNIGIFRAQAVVTDTERRADLIKQFWLLYH